MPPSDPHGAGHHRCVSSRPLPHRACGCRDRNQARALRGDQCSNWPRFLKPLYDPGRSDFPSPVLASALHAISQSGPSPSARNCGAGAPFAPTRWSLPRPFATMQAPRNPALCLVRTRLSWPPSAQSPFARSGRYPRRGGLESRLEGHYPLVAARTGSCARPSPSPRLRYARCARGLCRFSPVPAGRWPFPTLSLRPLCRCSDPYPAALLGCTCPFLHQGHRPHPTGNGFGARIYPHMAASVGSRIFVAAVIRSSSGSCTRSASRLLRPRRLRAGPPGLSHHASPGRLPEPGCGVATCSTWTTSGASPQPDELYWPATGAGRVGARRLVENVRVGGRAVRRLRSRVVRGGWPSRS